MPTDVIWLFGGFIAVLIAIFVWSHLAMKKRRRELALLAESIGWIFNPEPRRDFEHRYPQFKDFGKGLNNRVVNTIEGRNDRLGGSRIVYGDCRWTERRNNKRQRRSLSFVAVEPNVPLPTLEIRPDNVWFNLFDAFAGRDIEIEHDPAFCKAYRTTAPDEVTCKALLTPAVTSLFGAIKGKLRVRIQDNVILVTSARRIWNVAEVGGGLDWVRVLVETLDEQKAEAAA